MNNAQVAWIAAARTETGEHPFENRAEAYFTWLQTATSTTSLGDAQAALLAAVDRAGSQASPAEVTRTAAASLAVLVGHDTGDEVVWVANVAASDATASAVVPVGVVPADAVVEEVVFIPAATLSGSAEAHRVVSLVDETGPTVTATLALDAGAAAFSSWVLFSAVPVAVVAGAVLSVHDDAVGSCASPGGLVRVKLRTVTSGGGWNQ